MKLISSIDESQHQGKDGRVLREFAVIQKNIQRRLQFNQTENNPFCTGPVNDISSSSCGAAIGGEFTSYTSFAYRYVNEKNTCIKVSYKTNGDQYAVADVNMILPTGCTVDIDYFCDIRKMKQSDTSLEPYCQNTGYTSYDNDENDCDAFNITTAFNETMPTIVWSTDGTQNLQYKLKILDTTCKVYTAPDPDRDRRKIHFLVFGFVVTFLVGYLLGKKFRRPSAAPSTTSIDTSTEPLL